MKRYLLILLTTLILSSCNPNDDDGNYYFDYVPITTVDVPDEFVHGETYQLYVNYELPDDCTIYYDYDYIYRDETRIVATIGMVYEGNDCEESVTEGEYIINVEVRQSEDYIFKFWQGIDDNGENIYLIVEVPVIP